ncbi:MAG: hypothetical protein QOK00_2080 [Thermoleophilaceae bacterium]|jgi:uncharacterized protein (UPF0261 family)|nr:hypothetical protein [Thermoleophilaceae bacterium]
MTTVLLIGTFDTKGDEYRYVQERLHALGCATLTVDVGVLEPAAFAVDVARTEVAEAAGVSIEQLVATGDRGAAISTMAAGAATVVRRLFSEGRFSAIMALTGSGGASLAAAAMRVLPLGVPKMIVSTVVAGDTRPFLADSDITLVYPVVDIAGLNRFSERVLWNAAGAIAGMARARDDFAPSSTDRPLIGATMFGVTTPCVTRVRRLLDERGFETLVFNANGTGGRSMERLLADGELAGTVDVTTTELADELVGGILSAGPDRLAGGAAAGAPRVISLGALDMVNFGPADTVPERFADRLLYRHNPAVTLMRTSAQECAELGRQIAHKLNGRRGPCAVLMPLRGLSALSVEGQPFHDPDADAALFAALRAEMPAHVALVELDLAINDPEFADALAERFVDLYDHSDDRKELVTR